MNVGKKTLAVRFGKFPVIILYDLMMILPYFFIIILLNRSVFFMDYDLLLTFLSLPVAIKLIIDIHNKKDVQLNEVLFGTSNFLRLFFILLFIGIIL